LNLGISGSGKTTFAKQMKIITLGGFTEEEKNNQRQIVLYNIILGLQELIKQAEKEEYPIDPNNLKHCRYFKQLDSIETEWTEKIARKASILWLDPGIQKAFREDSHFQTQISHIDHFMGNLERITAQNYVPTNEDMLRARQRTSGEQTTVFIHEKIKYELYDCGGQKPERGKWEEIINSKESVSAIIYFVALDEYNVESFEEPEKTKMQISLEAWRDIIKSETIKERDITVLLFLNKIDLLTKKLLNSEERAEFGNIYPQYSGDGIDSATESVKKKFLEYSKDRDVSTHVICALDTGLMELIFKTIKTTVFNARLLTAGYKI